jgi:hypothetical protein
MKKGILFLLLVSSYFAEAQSLKEALFSGKLKNDNNTVIRKGDDLSTKMVDTTRKVTVDTTAKAKLVLLPGDSAAKIAVIAADSAALAEGKQKDSITSGGIDTSASSAAAPAAVAVTAPVVAATVTKDNNAMIKVYVDSVANMVKTEALPNKKIKKGMYYVTVSYAIGTDGKVEITDVFLSPENAYLHIQIKDRLELEPPQLTPVTNSAGTPRKVSRKYNFTLTKED